MTSRYAPGDAGYETPVDERAASDDDGDEAARALVGQAAAVGADRAEAPSTRACSGRRARDAATMLHRALGLPEPAAVTAHWGARQVRSVDYRVGERPVVH